MKRKFFDNARPGFASFVKTDCIEPVSAAGALIFATDGDGKKHFLLTKYADKNWPGLFDFGGKVDETDETIERTICRELKEESNEKIDVDQLDFVSKHYVKEGMYLCFVYRVDFDFMTKMTTEVFGTKEKEENIVRTCDWYELTPEVVKQLNKRIQFITLL